MSLIDNIKETPKWIWLAGGGLFIGLIALTRGGGSTTLPGLGQSSDLTDAIAGLKDSINNGGEGTTPPSGGGGGGTNTDHPPIPGSKPGITYRDGVRVIGIGRPGQHWDNTVGGYVMDSGSGSRTWGPSLIRRGTTSLSEGVNRVSIEGRTIYSNPGSGTVGVTSLPPTGISSTVPSSGSTLISSVRRTISTRTTSIR